MPNEHPDAYCLNKIRQYKIDVENGRVFNRHGREVGHHNLDYIRAKIGFRDSQGKPISFF